MAAEEYSKKKSIICCPQFCGAINCKVWTILLKYYVHPKLATPPSTMSQAHQPITAFETIGTPLHDLFNQCFQHPQSTDEMDRKAEQTERKEEMQKAQACFVGKHRAIWL